MSLPPPLSLPLPPPLSQLYRINQQWLADYNDLKKQLKVPSHHENPASQLPCQQCVAMEREVEEKKALVQDLQNQLEKTMAKSRDARRDLEEKNTVIQDLINECSALRLQVEGRREHSLTHSLTYTLLLIQNLPVHIPFIQFVHACVIAMQHACLHLYALQGSMHACMYVHVCVCKLRLYLPLLSLVFFESVHYICLSLERCC